MKKNIGTIDRILRIVIAVVIGLLYFMNIISGALGIVLLAVGAIFLLTSLAGTCLLYLPFGISTCPKEEAR